MKRQPGWYWTKLADNWCVGIWTGLSWSVTGEVESFDDQDFDVIGQRIPDPDEPWQCVPKEPTEPMLRHATHEMSWNCKNPGSVYKTMLAHSPSPDETP